jgi:hypothetical protein
MLSCQNILNGLVRVTTKMLFKLLSSSSSGAIALASPSFRICSARRSSNIGPYVSGQKNIRGMKDIPANMDTIQNDIRQPN